MEGQCLCCSYEGKLTKHHIIPKKVGGPDRRRNLAYLCMDCHALVERYYWRQLSRRCPLAARTIKEIANAFKAKRIPPDCWDEAQERQQRAWRKLLQEPAPWREWFDEACMWIATVEIVTPQVVANSITSKPWWRPRLPQSASLARS